MGQEIQLITQAEIADFYSISKNTDTTRIDGHIWRGQRIDVKPILGAELYFDMMNHLSESKYQLLLKGGTYTPNQYEIYFQGVQAMLAAFAYSRLMSNNDTFVSPSGNRIKSNQFSNPQQKTVVDDKSQMALSDALSIANDVRAFLENNPTQYPLYNVAQFGHDEQRTSFTIIKV